MSRIIHYMEMTGFTWLVPVVRLAKGENRREQMVDLFNLVGLPLIAIGLFLLLWAGAASQVKTSLGELPGPVQVWEQAGNLYDDHLRERERGEAFLERQRVRNEERLAADPQAEVRWCRYSSRSRPWPGCRLSPWW